MLNHSAIRFDQALGHAVALLRGTGFVGAHLVLVRDLYGRLHLAVDDREPWRKPPSEALDRIRQALASELGAFGPDLEVPPLLASELVSPATLFGAPSLLLLHTESPRISLLERQVMGSDWLLKPPVPSLKGGPEAPRSAPHRVTMFGIKGGVGRSTATALWAQRLAQRDARVLVIDLDLESPGVGSFLLPDQVRPEFGVIDWLVEDAVGQADISLTDNLVARSPLSGSAQGEVLVIPASGQQRPGYNYLAKLSRAYVPVPHQDGVREFGDRIVDFVHQMEETLRPQVVILDSRAGLHDIAAAAITRLDALCFLFAGNSRQTWEDYGLLFRQWSAYPERTARLRENLQMVAALIPETGAETYLERFRLSSYKLFEDSLYEESAPEELDTFNYGINDEEAPHQPLRIRWSRAFLEYDPLGASEAIEPAQIEAAFGHFMAGAERMTLGEEA